MKYTEEIHAHMLLIMLNTKEPCADRNCPFSLFRELCGEKINFSCGDIDSPEALAAEEMCLNFVGTEKCPCWDLGANEAMRRTFEVLKEKGYM